MRKSTETILVICAVLTFLTLSLVGSHSSEAASTEPIKVGCMLDLTSYLSMPSKTALQGIQMRLEEVGSIAGRPVQLIVEDDASNPDQAIDKARKLVERDKVKAIIGPLGGVPAEAVAKYLAEKRVPSTAITGQTDEAALMRGLMYLVNGHNSQGGYTTGVYAYDAGFRTVITSSMDYVAGHSLIEGFAQAFKERGGKIIQQQWIPPTATDYSSFIMGMQKADAAVVFFVGTATVPFFRQYAELAKMPVVEAYSEIEFPENMAELGAIPAKIPVVSGLTWIYTDPGKESQAFVSKYKQKHGGRPTQFAELGYSSAAVVFDALKRAGADASQEAVIKAFNQTDLQMPQGRIKFNKDHIGISNMRYIGYEEKGGNIEIVQKKKYQALSELTPDNKFKITLVK